MSSDAEKRIQELEAALRDAKKRVDDANKRAEKRVDDANKRAEKLVDDANKRAEKLVDDEIKKRDKTVFFELLQNVHTFVPPLLNVETDPKKASGGQVAKVAGKVYPRRLKLWEEFPQLHCSTFDRVTTVLGDRKLFASAIETLAVANSLSPHKRRNEEDIRPFIRAYLELSSADIVNKYLEATHVTFRFRFDNSHRGTSQWLSPKTSRTSSPSSGSAPSKRKYQDVRRLAPDRWGMRTVDDEPSGVLVGEYKAAHLLPNAYYRNVLGTPGALPAESLVVDCAARAGSDKTTETETTETTREAPDVDVDSPDASATAKKQSDKERMAVCRAICQAYHYMMLFGIQYGYISSGVGSVFLKVSPATRDTLYYHYVDHTIPAVPISSPGTDLVHTPQAQLVTLLLEALAVEPVGAENVFGNIATLPVWPDSQSKSRKTTSFTVALGGPPPRNDEGGNDGGGDGGGDGGDAGTGTAGHGGGSGSGSSNSTQQQSCEPPRNEYCTQACLLGLARGGRLDPRCPNTPEHVRAGGCKSVRLGPGGEEESCHAITATELCTMLVAQQTRCYSSGVKSLFFHGLHGAVGTLYKMSLLEYGYTFVGKGVGDEHRASLDHEASIYIHPTIQPLQGRLIPVFLGIVELEEYPFLVINGVVVWHLLLMSWVGDSLEVKPRDRFWDYEKMRLERFLRKLDAHGLAHYDLRPANAAWSVERGCLMAIDFDHAEVLGDEDMEEAAGLYHTSSEGSPQPTLDYASTADGSVPAGVLESLDSLGSEPATAIATPQSLGPGLTEKRGAPDDRPDEPLGSNPDTKRLCMGIDSPGCD